MDKDIDMKEEGMVNKKNKVSHKKAGFSNKSIFLLSLFIILSLAIFFLLSDNSVSSAGEVSYCCERTTDGAWCQSVDSASQCATGGGLNPAVPTSCESTSYCSVGTCINRLEGTCSQSPQRACQDNGGSWDERALNEIPQCQAGCCLIGDQAAFVTQANCNRLSSLYNLNINFRKDIKNQDQCLALAFPQAKGACVFDDGLTRNCEMLTKSECLAEEERSSATVEFHQGLLCSAESLETICGPSERTTCVEDKDEVYFIDNCGNLANIYDAEKADDPNYWTVIVEKGESCSPDSSNANSKSCGNCDYLAGSTCKAYQRGNSQTVQPQMGNNICADLSCEYNGKAYQHGESWCATSSGFTESAPGSESYRMVCYNGEVTTEECPSFREQVCAEEEVAEDFTSASCVVNRFRDCFIQDNKVDCEDETSRDCTWVLGETNNFFRDNSTPPNKYVLNQSGNSLITKAEATIEAFETGGVFRALNVTANPVGASCVPKYAPGFKFWEDENRTMCQLADDWCLVKYEKSILGGLDWDCKDNCWCIENDDGAVNEDWLTNRRGLCTSLGDCGISNNYLGGASGFKTGDDIVSSRCEDDDEGKLVC